MTAHFDKNGDLWVEIDRGSLPEDSTGLELVAEFRAVPGNPSIGHSITKLNLATYVRRLGQPDWLNAAMSRQDMRDWLDTVPGQIEPT